MYATSQGLDGPDFLDAIADESLAHGLTVNADAYSERARQWRADRALLDEQACEIATLRAQLAKLRPLASAPRYRT